MTKRDIENAAVGQLQTCAHAKLGEAKRLVIVMRCDPDASVKEIVSHGDPLSDPDAADEDFRERDRVNEHLSRRAGQQEFGGRPMVRIDGIEVRDEDARVHRDHVGQSVLNSSR